MKILFINLPYYGHVIPTLGLVKELIRMGNQVTYLVPFDWKDKIDECGAEFAGYKNHKKLDEQIKNAYAAAVKITEEFDLIIYEQFFSLENIWLRDFQSLLYEYLLLLQQITS